MKVFALVGLVTTEKISFAEDLRAYYVQQSIPVKILAPHSSIFDDAPPDTVGYRAGAFEATLRHSIEDTPPEVLIAIVDEQIFPDDLIFELENLRIEKENLDIQTIALIDSRTCDCFPHVRQQFESYADYVIQLPYEPSEMIRYADLS